MTLRDHLARQLDTSWRLLSLHLTGLEADEVLWRPAAVGPHVREVDGTWLADWPEREDYDAGPPSIAWLTWHIGFWWTMVLDHSFGDGALRREDVRWPGPGEATRRWLGACRDRWTEAVGSLDDAELGSVRRSTWPMQDRPFGDVVAWVNVELMKNAAEIGYARFLYATRPGASGSVTAAPPA